YAWQKLRIFTEPVRPRAHRRLPHLYLTNMTIRRQHLEVGSNQWPAWRTRSTQLLQSSQKILMRRPLHQSSSMTRRALQTKLSTIDESVRSRT
ncbi:hypothetical protein MYU51_004988, partial [Penicillium brevicompactum]